MSTSQDMLKTLINLIIFSSLAFSYTLEKEYEVSDVSVYSTDIIKECDRKFFLFSIPHNQQTYQHPSFEIVKLFNQFGCKVDEVDFGRVTFHVKAQKSCLQDELKNHFLSKYPTLKISNIFIKQNSYFDCSKSYEIQNIPDRKSGSMKVVQKGRSYFFRYSIEGKVKRWTTSTSLERSKPLTSNNTDFEYVEFEDLNKKYLDTIENKVAKYNLPKDKVLTEYMVKEKPAVMQNHTVKCRYNQGNILIEFEATAQSDGNLGEEIRVKKELEIYRGKVIGTNLVEIL